MIQYRGAHPELRSSSRTSKLSLNLLGFFLQNTRLGNWKFLLKFYVNFLQIKDTEQNSTVSSSGTSSRTRGRSVWPRPRSIQPPFKTSLAVKQLSRGNEISSVRHVSKNTCIQTPFPRVTMLKTFILKIWVRVVRFFENIRKIMSWRICKISVTVTHVCRSWGF